MIHEICYLHIKLLSGQSPLITYLSTKYFKSDKLPIISAVICIFAKISWWNYKIEMNRTKVFKSLGSKFLSTLWVNGSQWLKCQGQLFFGIKIDLSPNWFVSAEFLGTSKDFMFWNWRFVGSNLISFLGNNVSKWAIKERKNEWPVLLNVYTCTVFKMLCTYLVLY